MNMAIEPVNKLHTIPKEHTDPIAFFQTSYQMFQKAEQITGNSIERFYDVGGESICLRFAGPSLVPYITAALEHLSEKASTAPSLTVCIWDDVSTQTQMPPPPWLGYSLYNPNGNPRSIYTRRGDVLGYNNPRIYTAYNWGANVLSILDKKQNLALHWTHNARQLPSYETTAPLRQILHWWGNHHERQLIHGGAVGTSEGGVLLAGKGGTGKSTTALTCLNSDMAYVSDDYCLITTKPIPYAYSIYSSAKLNKEDLQRNSHLMPAMSTMNCIDTEKAVFFLHPHFENKIVAGFPVRAILLPRITGGPETAIKPASPMEGLKALSLSTISQLARAGDTSLKIMKQLVDQVPCYFLELGTNFSKIPTVILNLLKKGYFVE